MWPTNQSTNWTTKQTARQLANQPTNHPNLSSQSTKQATNHPTNQLSNQLTNHSANQPTINFKGYIKVFINNLIKNIFDTHSYREPNSSHFVKDNHNTFSCILYANYQRNALQHFEMQF